MFGCKSASSYNCSIRASFSIARSVISGGYHRSSFESVIKTIVRWLQIRLQIWLRTMRDWRRWAIRVSPSLPPGLYRNSPLWCSNRASCSANALCDRRFLHLYPPPVGAVVELQWRSRRPRRSENKLIIIIKVIILYKARKCDSSIAIRVCRVAVL